MNKKDLLKTVTTLAKRRVITLANGTKIETNSENMTAFIVNESERTPLPSGDYEMNTGKYLVIDPEGTIKDIIVKQPTKADERIKKELNFSKKKVTPKQAKLRKTQGLSKYYKLNLF